MYEELLALRLTHTYRELAVTYNCTKSAISGRIWRLRNPRSVLYGTPRRKSRYDLLPHLPLTRRECETLGYSWQCLLRLREDGFAYTVPLPNRCRGRGAILTYHRTQKERGPQPPSSVQASRAPQSR